MTILVVYSGEPNFPPTDQQPEAQRAEIGGYWVDYLGDEPTGAEVSGFLSTPITPETNGVALEGRQRKAAKDDAAAFASAGDFKAAFGKLLEII